MSRLMSAITAASKRRSFDPLSLSPALWLDASDASTLFDATTGGSLVAADGAVARWEDKSGNARHATQETGSSQFQRKTGILNGRDILRSSGSPKHMRSALSLAGLDDATIFAVLHASSLTNYQSALRWQESDPSYLVYPWGSSAIFIHAPDGATSGVSSGLVANEWNIGVARRQRNISTGLQTWRNGAAVASRSTANATIAPDASQLTLGRYSLGAVQYSSGEYFIGDYAEILVFTTALSTTDRQAVESYLASKWNITLAS
jgi:hypothetical protein